MNDAYILRKKDKVYKPVPLKALRTLVYQRQVDPDDMISKDDGNTWTLAGKLTELIQFFPSHTPSLSLGEVPRGYGGKIERRRKSIEVIDMIPMIDMVFLLLIFFALTSTFEIQRVMEMNLPKAASGDQLQKKQTLTLTINSNGHITIEKKPVELQDLESMLNQSVLDSAGVTLIIKGDAQVSHGKVVQLMDIANAVGVKKILITVKSSGN